MARKKQVSKEKKAYKPFDFILFITVLLLLALGIIMVLSASSPSSLATTGSSYTYVFKQLLCAIAGIAAMIVLSKIDYKVYSNRKFYMAVFWISFLILWLVLVPGLGRSVNGARRWIKFPIISSLQPSEFTKIGIIIFFAGYLTENRNNLKRAWKGFFLPIILFLLPVVGTLLLVQSHLSASIVIIAVVLIMMIVAGCKISHFLTLGVIGGGVGGVALYALAKFYDVGAYRLKRLTSFLNPWSDAQGSGWQIIQSLYAIGSGGVFGVGLRRQQTKIFIYI